MSIAERYLKAVGSAHLRCNEHKGDIDPILAAGMIQQGRDRPSLGILLYRLRGEFDAAMGSCRRADSLLDDGSVQEKPEHVALRLRAFVMMELKNLTPVVQAVGRYALAMADRHNVNLPAHEVRRLAGQVIDVWLDPGCAACTGRGFSGGYKAPQVLCVPCGSTGRRKVHYGDGHEFGRWLFDDLSSKMLDAEHGMRRKLR